MATGVLRIVVASSLVLCLAGVVLAQPVDPIAVERWMEATASAAGVNKNAQDEAVKAALRKAVEQGCGVFLDSHSKDQDYKLVYDKVFTYTAGYVKEYKTVKTWIQDDKSFATVRALVSTQKFEKAWADIAHTLNQENNPRVIVVVAESTIWTTTGPIYRTEETGTVQTKIEDFFLDKKIQLMDRATAVNVSKRDILLAAIKDDTREIASLGARFHADVVVVGQASAKYGNQIEIGGQTMHQYVATLNLRVVQTDSAKLLVSKSFGPITANSLQKAGGEEKALAKLAEEAAPRVLAAALEAWRERANVKRTVQLSVSGMDYDAWRTFKTEAEKIDGVQALRLRDITESVANIDVEYNYTNENLADRLTEMKGLKLSVTEITANRIKLMRK